jgi:hypothetical protein
MCCRLSVWSLYFDFKKPSPIFLCIVLLVFSSFDSGTLAGFIKISSLRLLMKELTAYIVTISDDTELHFNCQGPMPQNPIALLGLFAYILIKSCNAGVAQW